MRVASALAAFAVCGVASADFFDDFNRADGGIGSNYNLISGPAINVLSNKAVGTSSSAGMTLVASSVFTASYNSVIVSADLSLSDTSSTLAYCGLILGNDGTTTADHGFMVKLQRQSGTGFSNIGVYTGQATNSANVQTTGGNFQTLPTNIAACRMSIWCSDPSTLQIGLDTDFNGTNDVSYTAPFTLANMTFGNRVGMHIFGTTGQIDNFRVTPVPEPATMVALGLGSIALLRRRRKA